MTGRNETTSPAGLTRDDVKEAVREVIGTTLVEIASDVEDIRNRLLPLELRLSESHDGSAKKSPEPLPTPATVRAALLPHCNAVGDASDSPTAQPTVDEVLVAVTWYRNARERLDRCNAEVERAEERLDTARKRARVQNERVRQRSLELDRILLAAGAVRLATEGDGAS
ncbi:hypothetical protein [Rhodococcus ruber]|uniref:hypothetical protein n=1 Tax=Rhodococcus ruber TaxID=1830 RepID=UPI003D81356C